MLMTKLFSRNYSDYYLPIGTHPSKRPSGRVVFFAGLLVVSLVINLVVFIGNSKRFVSPLDEYQELKNYPLVDDILSRRMAPASLAAAHENAIVTTLYSDSYAPAVAALGHSLLKVNTTARLIVLYLPQKVSSRALCIAASSGFVPHAVRRIPPPHNGTGIEPRFSDQYTKLTLWTLDALLDPVRALVYIDADCLATRNFDELFTLPYNFAAVPDVYGDARGFTTNFNAGVMFIRPDSNFFHAMIQAMPKAKYPPNMAEQAFLNQYFATDVLRLPYAYNGNLELKERSPHVWSGIKNEMRIIHYTLVKPFVTKDWGTVPLGQLQGRVNEAGQSKRGMFREEMMYWGKIWEETSMVYAHRIDQCRDA